MNDYYSYMFFLSTIHTRIILNPFVGIKTSFYFKIFTVVPSIKNSTDVCDVITHSILEKRKKEKNLLTTSRALVNVALERVQNNFLFTGQQKNPLKPDTISDNLL